MSLAFPWKLLASSILADGNWSFSSFLFPSTDRRPAPIGSKGSTGGRERGEKGGHKFLKGSTTKSDSQDWEERENILLFLSWAVVV